MPTLRQTLLANAVFSGTAGTFLVIFPGLTAHFLGLPAPPPLQIIGGGLLLFAVFVFWQVRKEHPLAVLLIILMDVLWVLGSIGLLAFPLWEISVPGQWIIAGVAVIVLLFATFQSLALSRVDAVDSNATFKQLAFHRTVAAPPTQVWAIIADVAHYDTVAPNIDRVQIVAGEKEGMVRSCTHNQHQWTETCTYWEEGSHYTFEVNTDEPGFPYPFSSLRGTWGVERAAEGQTTIWMQFDFRYHRWIQALILHPLLHPKLRQIAETLLNNWQQLIESSPD